MTPSPCRIPPSFKASLPRLEAVVLVAAIAVLLPARHSGAFSFSDELRIGDHHVSPVAPTALYRLLSRACPDSRVRVQELDAVRAIEGKLAIAAALRAAGQPDEGLQFGKAGPDGEYRFANTPREVASAVRMGLGADSLISRGVDTLAFVADAAEYTAQVPLDQINSLAEMLVHQSRRMGLRNFPVFRFRSRIENDRAGVILSARRGRIS